MNTRLYDENEYIPFIYVILPLIAFVVIFCGSYFLVFLSAYVFPCSTIHDWSEYFSLPPNGLPMASFYSDGSENCTRYIQLEIPASEFDSFLASTLIDQSLSSITLPESIGGIDLLQERTGWDVSSVTSYLAGEGHEGLNSQIIFVDTSNPQKYVVYLVTSINWI